MGVSEIFIASLVGLIIWSYILSSIIQSGARSKQIELQLKIQSLLLAKMAQKQGVSDEEVNNIINIKK